MTAELLAAQTLARTASSHTPSAVDKWQILRDLGLARSRLQISDRDLAVLAALISFHRDTEIPPDIAIVFPSNATLSQRAHGMAESTLRRHLAALVNAGLILRHDSPNGKRYAVRGHGAALDRAFGFDLSPLARRAAEIADLAEQSAHAAEHLRRLREAIVLRLRDCEKLIAYATHTVPGNHDALSDAILLTKRQLRRKLDVPTLDILDAQVEQLAAQVNTALARASAEEMDANVGRFERHIQDSNTLFPDSNTAEKRDVENAAPGTSPQIPLPAVLQACPEILAYAPHGIRNWHDLVSAASFVRGMMGITAETWHAAQSRMSPKIAAIALACILQTFDRIANPGGYLRTLIQKATQGKFSPTPMVMALLRMKAMQAA